MVLKLVKKVIPNKTFSKELKKFFKTYKKKINIYKDVSEEAKLPPCLVAAIHYRESGCNFKTYLHNGDPLGKPTTHVPKGKYFNKFEDAAADALNEKKYYRKKYKLKANSKNIPAMLSYAEAYNGLGYYNRGLCSPYVYSGTNLYDKGKFTADGKYDASVKDKQPGIYVLIKKIMN